LRSVVIQLEAGEWTPSVAAEGLKP